jgi:hypothetical protein
MGYQYLFQYKNLETGSFKRVSSFNEKKLTIDQLFLQPFIDYMDSISSDISHHGKDYYPRKISDLSADSAILFSQMEFKILSGQENILKSLGFGRR